MKLPFRQDRELDKKLRALSDSAMTGFQFVEPSLLARRDVIVEAEQAATSLREPLLAEDLRTDRSPRRHRVVLAAALATLATTGVVGVRQYAANETKKTTELTTATQTDDGELPRLILHDPNFQLGSYSEGRELPLSVPVPATYGRVWDVTTIDFFSLPPTGVQKDVAIGDTNAVLTRQPTDGPPVWMVRWTLGNHTFYAYTVGDEPSQGMLDVLGSSEVSDRAIRISRPGIEGSQPDQYSIVFPENGTRVTARLLVSKEVTSGRTPMDYLPATGRPKRFTITRQGRTYEVETPPSPGDGSYAGISWTYSPGIKVGLLLDSGSSPGETSEELVDQLITLGQHVVPATLREWRQLTAKGSTTLLRSTEPSSSWEIHGYLRSSTDPCNELSFEHGEIVEAQCVADAKPFHAVKASRVGTATIVWGSVDESTDENQVVRILDANGHQVGIDIAQDPELVPGRAFAIQLPEGATGPFTVELYEFDREWYAENGTGEDDYLKPGSTPISSRVGIIADRTEPVPES